MYDVRIGSYDLYGVISVEVATSRDIKVYDGVGSGKFPKANNRNLTSYALNCELSDNNDYNCNNYTNASSIFRYFDSLLSKEKAVRLIVYSERKKISKLVLLESYTSNEKEKGVYDVNLKLVEYEGAKARTTNIPQIVRQGKTPTPPPQPIKVNNAFNATKQILGTNNGVIPTVRANFESDYYFQKDTNLLVFKDPKTGEEIVNKSLIGPQKLVKADVVKPTLVRDSYTGEVSEIQSGLKLNSKANNLVDKAKKTFNSIGNKLIEIKREKIKYKGVGVK